MIYIWMIDAPHPGGVYLKKKCRVCVFSLKSFSSLFSHLCVCSIPHGRNSPPPPRLFFLGPFL